MASRMKEDEKNEKIIRGLLKLPVNRRCINCNNLGPQYVCTTFSTFICTNCSGIHREFTHRVKSISMAKFTSQEVLTLQERGNEHAKKIYFKEWDPQRHSVPDSSNIDRLRDFIKHVYVDQRYTGERNIDRPPRVNMGDREDSNENRRADSYRGGSRSPPYDDRYSEQAGYGGRNGPRSPGYDGGDQKRSPGSDGFGNGNQNQRFDDRRFPDVPKPEGRSPDHQKDIDASSPPMIRPLRDILGGDMPTLRVGDPPKSNGLRIPDNSAKTQRTLSSSSIGSSDGTAVQLKRVNSGSLIDFNADPEPPVPTAVQHSVSQQSTSPPADGLDWASFDIASQQKTPQVAPSITTLESALGQLSVAGSAPGGNISTLPVSGVDSFHKTDNGGATMQSQQTSLFPSSNNQFTNPQFDVPNIGAVNQSWGFSLAPNLQAPNLQAPLTAPVGHSSQVATRPHQEKSSGVSSQLPTEAKPSGREELPAILILAPSYIVRVQYNLNFFVIDNPQDLFASIYLSAPMSALGWQRGPHMGMGYGMQYPAGMLRTMPMPTIPHSSKSTNPFDLINEPASAQGLTFPSMAPLQGALPSMAPPSSLLHTSNFGTPSPQWMPPQPSYPPAISQSPYMMQQGPSNMPQQMPNNMIPLVYQGIGGSGFERTAFGTSGMDQNSSGRYSQMGTPNSFSPLGGNPFG